MSERKWNVVTEWNQLPLLLTTTEVARLCRIDKDTVSRLCKRGEIPGAALVGKEWRINRNAIAEMFGAL